MCPGLCRLIQKEWVLVPFLEGLVGGWERLPGNPRQASMGVSQDKGRLGEHRTLGTVSSPRRGSASRAQSSRLSRG